MDTQTWVVAMALAICLLSPARAGVIFSQDFSSAPNGPVSTYVGDPPNAGQFNVISWSGDKTSGGINSGALFFTRQGNGGAYFVRDSNFSPTPNAIIYNFDLEVTGNSVAYTSAATWAVGSGFSTSGSL